MPCECGAHSCFCFNVCRCRDRPCGCELCAEIRLHSCSICQRPAFLEGRFLTSAHFKEYCCCFIGESEVLPDQSAANPEQDPQDQYNLQDPGDPVKVGGWPPLVIPSSEYPECTEHKLATALKSCAVEDSDVEVEKNAPLKVSDSDRESSQKTESYLPLGVGSFQQTLMTKSQKATAEQNLEKDQLSKAETQIQRKGPSEEDPGNAKDSGQLPSEKPPPEATDSKQLTSEKGSSDERDSVPLQSDLHSDKTSSESTKLEKHRN